MAVDQDVRYTVTAEDRFSATFARLKKDLATGGDELGRIAAVAQRASGTLASVAFAGAGVGVVSGLRQLANDLDALNDAGDALGDSIENISALEDVARRTGGSLDLVVSAGLKLNKVLSEAKPDSPMAQALQSIGLSAEDLRNTNATDALRQIALALRGYEDDANKARLVQELFGKTIREVAPFLKDLSEAGTLNATVTRQQAEEAERFNKELFALQTNASNAARSLVSDMLPAVNQLLVGLRTGSEVFGGFFGVLSAALKKDGNFKTAADGVSFYTKELERLDKKRAELAADQRPLVRTFGPGGVDKEIADAQKYLEFYTRLAKAVGQTLPGAAPTPRQIDNALASRQSVPNVPGVRAPAIAQISEAERYLEQLQKQQDKLQDLTTVQQLLADLEGRRIDGVTPKLRTQLFLEAARVDVLRDQNRQLRDQQSALDDLVSQVSARSTELDSILEGTESGQRRRIERQIDVVLKFARANEGDEAVQRQALAAVDELGRRLRSVGEQPKAAIEEITRLEQAVQDFAENSIDAIADFATTGDGQFNQLFRSLRRDVLKTIIEDPIRDSMRSAVNIIKSELSSVDGDVGKLLSNLFRGVGSALGFNFDTVASSGATFGTLAGGSSFDMFGFTGRANGGPVRAGQLVRWQENGREWFVPDKPGRVVTEQQMMGAAGGGFVQENHFHISGNDTAQLRRELQAALEERDAKLMRSLRNGRAGAYAGV